MHAETGILRFLTSRPSRVPAPGIVTGVSKGMVWVQDAEGRIIKVKKANVRPAGLGLIGLP